MILWFKFILTNVIPKQTVSRILSFPVTLPVFIPCAFQKGSDVVCLWLGDFDQSVNHTCQWLLKFKPKLYLWNEGIISFTEVSWRKENWICGLSEIIAWKRWTIPPTHRTDSKDFPRIVWLFTCYSEHHLASTYFKNLHPSTNHINMQWQL